MARESTGGDLQGAAPRGRWTLLALLMLISAAHQFHRQGFSSLSNVIKAEQGFSEQMLGNLMSAFFLTYTFAMIPGGLLADRIGTWWTLLVVIAGSAVGGGLVGAAGWLGAMSQGAAAVAAGIFLARIAMGLVSAPLYPSTSRTVSGWFPIADRSWANGFVSAAATVGIAVASPLLSRLAQRIGWRAALVTAGLATMPFVLLWALRGRESPTAPPPSPAPQGFAGPPHSWLRLLAHRGILALSLSYFAVGYFEYVLMNWLKYYFSDIRKLSEDDSADYTAIPNYAFAIFAPLGGLAGAWCMRRFGLRRGLRIVPMTCMTLAAASLVAGALAEGIFAAVAGVTLAMAFIGASEGPFWTAAVHLGGKRGAAAAGILNTGGNIPGIIAPAATPWIASMFDWFAGGKGAEASTTGWTGALIVTSAICLAGVSFWLWVDAERPAEPAPTTT